MTEVSGEDVTATEREVVRLSNSSVPLPVVQSGAVFSVRSAESPNGGARIPGASEDGRKIAEKARGGLLGFKAKNHPQQIAKNGASDEVDDRGTSPEVFDPLMQRFDFTLDVAAAPHNAKVPRYFDRTDDGLRQPWSGERVWCNPPYSQLREWVEKAWREWNGTVRFRHRPQLIVMLVPANRPEQGWWQDWIEPHRDLPHSPLRVEFLRGRQRFIRHWLGHDEVKPNERPPFGCCLLIWQSPTERESAPPRDHGFIATNTDVPGSDAR